MTEDKVPSGKVPSSGVRFVYQHSRIDKETGELRAYPTGDKPDWVPAERGGETVCIILLGDKVLSRGVADCSKVDPFCYRIGRLIAKGRALKDAGLLGSIRTMRKRRKAEARRARTKAKRLENCLTEVRLAEAEQARAQT